MKIIPLSSLQSDPSLYKEIEQILNDSKIVCYPTPSGYKLAADLTSTRAIMSVLQAKRRIKNAPSLVLVPDEGWVSKVASNVSETARALMKAFWPGPLTLLFLASDELPPKVRRALTKAKGWLGVRLPSDDVSSGILKVFNKPLLVTSANLAKKHGANSASQVRKNFGRTVDTMIDDGDLETGKSSTLVDMTNGLPSVIRAGAISEAEIRSITDVA
jgi:L-threonylcarbamoyladenylate synthase